VSDSRAENACVVILIRPDNDCFCILSRSDFAILQFAFFLVLETFCEPVCGFENLNVVVKLFVNGRPVTEDFGDRVLLFDDFDRYRFLGAVAARLNAEVIEP